MSPGKHLHRSLSTIIRTPLQAFLSISSDSKVSANVGTQFTNSGALRTEFCDNANPRKIFVAQIMGHSSINILQTYAKAIDAYRRSAISKLEAFRASQVGAATTEENKDASSIQ